MPPCAISSRNLLCSSTSLSSCPKSFFKFLSVSTSEKYLVDSSSYLRLYSDSLTPPGAGGDTNDNDAVVDPRNDDDAVDPRPTAAKEEDVLPLLRLAPLRLLFECLEGCLGVLVVPRDIFMISTMNRNKCWIGGDGGRME